MQNFVFNSDESPNKVQNDFQLEEIEGLNNQVIKEELLKQQQQKLTKIDAELENYLGKLENAKHQLRDQQRNGNKNSTQAQLKKLRNQILFFENQVKQLQNRRQKVDDEYQKALQQEENFDNPDLLDNIFSKQQDAHHSEKRIQKRSLLEITIDDDKKFYISELFYNLLFKHQIEALNWLLSQHSLKKGSILADEMGLGKTIQTIALITTLQTTYHETLDSNYELQNSNKIGPILIVCPATVINQWVQELNLWTAGNQHQVKIYTFSGVKGTEIENLNTGSRQAKQKVLKEAIINNGIVIISYEFLRTEVELFQRKQWYYIILDEAQKIKNSFSLTHQAAISIQADHKLILSGTPIQNNLQELWSLFHFVQPGLLGELDYFENTFCKAIIQGGYTNATKVQQETARQCVDELRLMIRRHILRRTKKQLKLDCKLPDRNEYIVFCNLTNGQLNLYIKYLKGCQTRRNRFGHGFEKGAGSDDLAVLNNLRKICNHPFMFFAFHEAEKADMRGYKFNQQQLLHIPEFVAYNNAKNKLQNYKDNKEGIRQMECEIASQHWQLSGKLRVLMNFLKDWYKKDVTTKVLIFSQTKKMLDIIEKVSQRQNFSYLRMDGNINLKSRMELIDKFNNEDAYIFLLTTRVGGLGINLTSANKVIIFDPDWNPMVDIQATDRALRIGQKRDVTIYRFVVDDTIEEKIYHRQIFKKFMADKILQDPSKQKFFERSQMHELFELPKKTIDEDKELDNINQLKKRYSTADSHQSIENLEEEVKGNEHKHKRLKHDAYDKHKVIKEQTEISDEDKLESDSDKKLGRIYRVSKKIIKKDEKLSEFFKKTQQELSKIDDIAKRVKKDIENNLITSIFKNEEDQNKCQQDLDRFSNISQLKIKIEARQEASNLLSKLGGFNDSQREQEKNQQQNKIMTSTSIMGNLMMKKKQQDDHDLKQKQVDDILRIQKQQNDAKLDMNFQIRDYFKQKQIFETPSREILEHFKEYVQGDQFEEFREGLKEVAFFDKDEKVWILRD
ncbi:dna repair protein rhp26 [Stylonychia lemnae]|uniref:Dna repair protein rhp26 n=1 Tax=Stylonychia lemnae TaxID=5949 RepID=A0A077ZW26_STYLE|nr:dna repair protein rhp26 [Stylonychia lemnae]|eukprot:CDW73791.1 dna repair protein rhp26 [Stylonychia lemnae]